MMFRRRSLRLNRIVDIVRRDYYRSEGCYKKQRTCHKMTPRHWSSPLIIALAATDGVSIYASSAQRSLD